MDRPGAPFPNAAVQMRANPRCVVMCAKSRDCRRHRARNPAGSRTETSAKVDTAQAALSAPGRHWDYANGSQGRRAEPIHTASNLSTQALMQRELGQSPHCEILVLWGSCQPSDVDSHARMPSEEGGVTC